MADSAQNLPSGHLRSPLFKLIPTELRLFIYRATFAGSVIDLELHPEAVDPEFYPDRQSGCGWLGPLPVGGRRSVFCSIGRYVKPWQLLLTCKQIYDEAITIYWSEIILCNHKAIFSRGLFFERIPDFAKLHVQHLRDVQTCINPGVNALQGIAFTRQASFAEALDAFPKLKTCSVADGQLAMKPCKAVEEALVRHPEVHFLKPLFERRQLQRGFLDYSARTNEIYKVRI